MLAERPPVSAPSMKNQKALPKIEIEAGYLPGALIAERVRCGKPSCRCARGELHGPYHYRYWRAGGRLIKTYVRKADVDAVRAGCAEYQRLQAVLLANRRLSVTAYQQMNRWIRELERGG